MDSAASADSGDTRQGIASRQGQCVTTVDNGDVWQSRALKSEKESKDWEKVREKAKGQEEARWAKVGLGVRKVKDWRRDSKA